MIDINKYPIIRTNGAKRHEESISLSNNCKKEDYCDDKFAVSNPTLFVKNQSGNWIKMKPGKVSFESTKEPQAKWTVQVRSQKTFK